jgi:putative ABC transport system permease protein
MSIAASVPQQKVPYLSLAVRLIRRELRGFHIFIACIAVGVMAIASVGSFSRGLTEGLARESSVILGGDVSFILIQREANAAEKAFIASKGEVSTAATLRTMARGGTGNPTLVELKAVDGTYPLYGTVKTEPEGELPSLLAKRGDVFGVIADSTLMSRLGLKAGERITIGDASFDVRAELKSEPDGLANGVAFGPRLLVSQEALRSTGLIQPGSLVRWLYRLKLPASSDMESAVRGTLDAARAELPGAGWETRSRFNVSPQLERSIEQFTQYLTLVGLAALLVGGVGIANSTKYFLDRQRDVIATMKSIGATGGGVFAIYMMQVMALAVIGIVIGIVIGAALPFIVKALFGDIIPLPFVAQLSFTQLALACGYGILISLAFALWPLGLAHDVPVSVLFRGEVAPSRGWPRKRYIVGTVAAALLLGVFAVVAAYDRKIALIFIAAAFVVFLMLRGMAAFLMWAARRAPRMRSTIIRLAIANIHRPGALTPTVVLSLGLGIALLVNVMEIDGNLRQQFTAALPAKAPSFYFLDIPGSEAERFDAFVRQRAPDGKLERVPMLRGRIISARRVEADKLAPDPESAWVLQSDRGITYMTDPPTASRVVAGEWWKPDYNGPPLVSFEKKIADGLGLKLGDEVVVNVLGRNITARISNLRTLDWQSLGINFVMIFSPNSFRGAPVTHLATLAYPDGGTPAEENAMLTGVSDTFPGVTTVRVKDAINAFGTLVGNLTLAVRGASLITLIAAALVLGGALAAGHQHRVYDSVILKTLGATRRQLIAAYALEYSLLGFITAVFGVAAGSLAAWRIVTDLMHFTYTWQVGPAVAAAFGALLVTVGLGLIGTFSALGRKPAQVLRNL